MSVDTVIFRDMVPPGLSASDAEEDCAGRVPPLLALIPCGLKTGLEGAIRRYIESSAPADMRGVCIEANVNHELSFYPRIDAVNDERELPQVILSADYNSFLHRRFIDRFVSKNVFVRYKGEKLHPLLGRAGCADPEHHFRIFGANALVAVRVDDTDTPAGQIVSWGDLIGPGMRRKVVMRGQGDFFCSAVLLPFFRLFGEDAVVNLASSVAGGMHPAQMVKMIDSQRRDIPPWYIMPLFFAKKIRRTRRISIVYPNEGALVSPIMLLIKRDAGERFGAFLEFLTGREVQQYCADNFFPAAHPEVVNPHFPEERLYWPGWDFIYNNDIALIKERIGKRFTEAYRAAGGGS